MPLLRRNLFSFRNGFISVIFFHHVSIGYVLWKKDYSIQTLPFFSNTRSLPNCIGFILKQDDPSIDAKKELGPIWENNKALDD